MRIFLYLRFNKKRHGAISLRRLLHQKSKKRYRNKAHYRREQYAVCGKLALAVEKLGKIENDRGARHGGKHQYARLENCVQRQKVHRGIAEQRKHDQFRKTGQVDERSTEQLSERHASKPYAEYQHTNRSGRVAHELDGGHERGGNQLSHVKEAAQKSYDKTERVGIENTLQKTYLAFVARHAEYAHGERQNVERNAGYARVAHRHRVIREQRLDYRQSEKAAVAHNRSDGEYAVFTFVEFLAENKKQNAHKSGLQKQNYDEEQSHRKQTVRRRTFAPGCAYDHTRRADVYQYRGERGQVSPVRFFKLTQQKARQSVAQGNENVD